MQSIYTQAVGLAYHPRQSSCPEQLSKAFSRPSCLTEWAIYLSACFCSADVWNIHLQPTQKEGGISMFIVPYSQTRGAVLSGSASRQKRRLSMSNHKRKDDYSELSESGTILRAGLDQKKISQVKLAKEANLDKSYVSLLLREEHLNHLSRVIPANIRLGVFPSMNEVYEYLAAIPDDKLDSAQRAELVDKAEKEFGHEEETGQRLHIPLRIVLLPGQEHLRIHPQDWQITVKITREEQRMWHTAIVEPIPHLRADALFTDDQWQTLQIQVEGCK
jgi:transcriptional regulator with XRE-family HTH domain